MYVRTNKPVDERKDENYIPSTYFLSRGYNKKNYLALQVYNKYIYSQTFVKQSPVGKLKIGCLRQVLA